MRRIAISLFSLLLPLLYGDTLLLAQSGQNRLVQQLNAQAQQEFNKGNIKQARQYSTLALEESKRLEDQSGEADACSMIAKVSLAQQRYEEALQYFRQSTDLNRKTGRFRALAEDYLGAGSALRGMGKLDDAINQSESAIKIYLALGDSSRLAESLNTLGSYYKQAGNQAVALDLYNKSLTIRIRQHELKKIPESLNNIAIVYFATGEYDKALGYFYKVLDIFTLLNSKKDISVSLNNLGVLYITIGRYDQALSCYTQSLQINRELNDSSAFARDLNNIGVIYLEKGNDDKALNYFEQALRINKALGEKYESIDALGNIGLIYKKRKDYTRAREYLGQTLTLAQETYDKERIADYYRYMGQIAADEKNYAAALHFLEEGMKQARETGLKAQLGSIYQDLSSINYETGNYKTALEYYKSYIDIKDTLFNEARDDKMKELEARYQTAKKEKEIVKLNEETKLQAARLQSSNERFWYQLVIFISAFVIIGGFTLVYITRNRRKQKELIRQALAEQEKLRFISVIETEEKERKRIAGDLHDSLGQILSTARLNLSGLEEVINKTDSDYSKMFHNALSLVDEACTEIRGISQNIMPTALIRQGIIPAIENLVARINESQKLQVVFTAKPAGERLDENIEFALYRIIQECLGNIIKHAAATEVQLSLTSRDQRIFVEIRDNGKGMEVSEIPNSKGLGWKSIFSRVSILNGSIDISSVMHQGTRISIEFPARFVKKQL
jgi:signal transduction histidine kinase